MEMVGYLPKIVMLLSAAVFIVVIFNRLKLSPVLGYLVAGALIGEHGVGYINSEELSVFAKYGVVFLLFAIGLELTFERLIAMRWHVFGFGSAQVVLTAFVIGVITYMMGWGTEIAIVIGASLALSSTAIVLKVIMDNGEQSTQIGRLALANLLLQDFIVVPLLVLVPLLSSKSDGVTILLLTALLKAFVAMVSIFFIGRLVLRPLFRLIASTKSEELFIATTLLIVLGASLATHYLQLSLALGAFVAGLLVAETQYQHRVEDTIMPFKDLLMGLFFLTIGMGIDLKVVQEDLFTIIALSVALIIGKAGIIIVLCRLFRFSLGAAIYSGLLLSQGSEFAFILFGLASQSGIGILSQSMAEVLLLVVTVTMALTPALAQLGIWVTRRLDLHPEEVNRVHDNQFSDLSKHVIIAGFGRVGEMVAKMLEAKRLTYVVLEADAVRAKEGKKKGYPVYHGDPTRIETLQHIGADRARTVIVAIRDSVYLKKAVHAINAHYPYLPIIVRADDLRQANILRRLGAMVIVPETYEAGLQLAGVLLRANGMSEVEVSRLKNQFRLGNYEQQKEILE